MNQLELWERYRRHLYACEPIGLRLDISRMTFDDELFDRMSDPMARALEAMDELERGAIANVDEQRMVGHYWLRAPQLAPDETIQSEIEQAVADVKKFAEDVHSGAIMPERGDGFYVVLVVGIGGSALGPQLVCDALGGASDPMIVRFIDNTDPEGIDRTMAELEEALEQTLTIVISKSGGTQETLNGMLEVEERYKRAGLNFAKHAVAITGAAGRLRTKAADERWLRIFPLWDFVGGRTSVTSAVGLLPAALIGADVDALLGGARECDSVTRNRNIAQNPAALLALMWYYAGEGRGLRDMVVLPYRDRLALFGRYLQQLVMESLGKERDRAGNVVHQGLTVYGNKGTTDQHAYVQQLREGPNDFFATFIETLRARTSQMHDAQPTTPNPQSAIRNPQSAIEQDVTTGDYLSGFLQGTRAALEEAGRESITITFDELNPRTVGVLIALFERAVGLYAELIDVNAYDQPGVEAGKKAAEAVIDLQRRILAHLRKGPGGAQTAEEIAEAVAAPEAVETVYHVLEHAAANDDHGIERTAGTGPFDAKYAAEAKPHR